MSNIDKQALREAAEKHGDDDILALLDEMEAADALNKHLELAILKAEGCSEKLREKAEAAEKRIAELEARTVTLPAQKYCPGEYEGSVLWGETEVWNQAISECAKAIHAAGIGKGE